MELMVRCSFLVLWFLTQPNIPWAAAAPPPPPAAEVFRYKLSLLHSLPRHRLCFHHSTEFAKRQICKWDIMQASGGFGLMEKWVNVEKNEKWNIWRITWRLFTLMASFQRPRNTQQHDWKQQQQIHGVQLEDQNIHWSQSNQITNSYINLPNCTLPGWRPVLFLVCNLGLPHALLSYPVCTAIHGKNI